jgi:hypothetical protein
MAAEREEARSSQAARIAIRRKRDAGVSQNILGAVTSFSGTAPT